MKIPSARCSAVSFTFICLSCYFQLLLPTLSRAADVATIGPTNRFPMQGKETDWIDGDIVLASDQLVAVIAKPNPDRDANMTVRGVGGCLIDLTRKDVPSDQLSCFYPTAGRYQFFDEKLVETGELDGGGVFWRCRSSKSLAGNDTSASIEYQLRDGDHFLTVVTTIEGQDVSMLEAVDGVRADRTFSFSQLAGTNVAYCEDEMFRQTYGFESVDADQPAKWNADRMRLLSHQRSRKLSNDNQRTTWTTRIYPASSPVDLWGITKTGKAQAIQVTGAIGDQPRIKLSIVGGDAGALKLPTTWRSNSDGHSIVHLPPGKYQLKAEAIGHPTSVIDLNVGNSDAKHDIHLDRPATIIANVTDQDGHPIPCKATIYGRGDTPDPNFGLDTESGSVGNCVYSADGNFVRSIPSGSYEVVISHGPEYDAAFEDIEIGTANETRLDVVLKRVVDTTGWISAELHSHSSPSGDNTSEQLGRVENLLCEHIEFGPCTEHQRIESYDDQLQILGAVGLMATCTGIELTGQPLPLNHQNAFPLKMDPHAQSGGGPMTDTDPVAQIARLAMWDNDAEKVVQINHPNMRQMILDRDLNGSEDGGFSKMIDYADVIEVHPPQDIFASRDEVKASKRADESRMHAWMDLIASGKRVPAVVNTDAHYNLHGSGWLRNWVRCQTDDPAEIQIAEMVERLEGGQIVMSTGPFLNVTFSHASLSRPAEVGDTVEVDSETGSLAIKVECPNWLDINRVEVFVNGELQPTLSRTRASNPDVFADTVIKFDQKLTVQLPEGDSFIIVACIGEKMELGRVMGTEFGKLPPVAVSNPIFVKRK